MAIIFVVASCIRLRTISQKHLEFQWATAGYSMPSFRRFATKLFANAIEKIPSRLALKDPVPIILIKTNQSKFFSQKKLTAFLHVEHLGYSQSRIFKLMTHLCKFKPHHFADKSTNMLRCISEKTSKVFRSFRISFI